MPYVAQHIELLYSFSTCLRLNLSSFLLFNTSSRCARCRLVSVAIFAALVCSTPRVDLLVVDLSRQSTQSVLCVETSTRSACCSVVPGGYLNTLTFVGLVLVSSCFIHQNISTFFSSLSMRFMSCCFLYFCHCFPRCYQYTPSQKRTVYRTYI